VRESLVLSRPGWVISGLVPCRPDWLNIAAVGTWIGVALGRSGRSRGHCSLFMVIDDAPHRLK